MAENIWLDKGKQVLFVETISKKSNKTPRWYVKDFKSVITNPVDLAIRTKEELLQSLDPYAKFIHFDDPDKQIFLYNSDFLDAITHGKVFKDMWEFVESTTPKKQSQEFIEKLMFSMSQTALKMEVLRHKLENNLIENDRKYDFKDIEKFFDVAWEDEFLLTFGRKLQEEKLTKTIDGLSNRFPELPDWLKDIIFHTLKHIRGAKFSVTSIMEMNIN